MYQTIRLPKVKSKIHSPLFLLGIVICFGIPDLLPKAKLLDLPNHQNPASASLHAQSTHSHPAFAPVNSQKS